MEYKDSLQMPQTDFEMRGNLPQKEPTILSKWQSQNHYEQILKKNEGKMPFILHDGPPYANGNLHAGTAMNRTIKDIIVRSKAMAGFYTPFFPGWDTHGLPIENAISKLGVNRKQVTPLEFRQKCRDYALEQIETQKATEIRLGQVADYDHPYITLNKEFEARQVKAFAKMAMDGLIYQGKKPIYWSPYQETAIADSEIVYFDKEDITIYVAFKVKDHKNILDNNTYFVIWTTTPWTIPANEGICLNPDFDYACVNVGDKKLIILHSMVDKLLEKFNLKKVSIDSIYKGKQLEYISCYHPLDESRQSLVIVGDHVTDVDGTGCVHTAGGHGVEDFIVSNKYGLDIFCPVDEKGHFTKEAGTRLEGKFVFDGNTEVIEMLKENNSLLHSEKHVHSYPHDDRLKKPVIFRATVQWFASIEKIKPQLLESISKVKWHNSFGEVRLTNMIKDRKDWCISRQRLWGVPIPIIYNEDKTPIIEKEVFDNISNLFAQYGSNIWFEKDAKDLLPSGYTNPKSPNSNFTKEKDIMDVWFDSGTSWTELEARGYTYPCDLYFEGSDQYRGWFNSSLSVSVACNNTAPYKAVLSHGFVCDSKGEAMHKSSGNVVNPIDVIDKYGADILRLWAATSDFKSDMRIGESNLKQVSDQYRKIRNTFKFLLGNLNENDFNPETDLQQISSLHDFDKYILTNLNKVIDTTKSKYNEYDFVGVCSTLLNFMVNDLSSYYCDYSKDILYCDAKDSLRRRQVQTVLYYCLDALLKLFSPILAFTCDEAYCFLSFKNENVHFTHFPNTYEIENALNIQDKFKRLNLIRDDILKALENARSQKLIGKALEAKVKLHVSLEDKNLIVETFKDSIEKWLIVSEVEFVEETLEKFETIEVEILKAEGQMCPRCWNITRYNNFDNLCNRCNDVMKK